MRVGISAYLHHRGADYRSAGISIYCHNLLLLLPRVHPEHSYVAFQGSDAPAVPDVQAVPSLLPTVRPPIRIAWEQLVLPLQAAHARVDLLHGTVNVVPVLARLPTVVTVHDLSFVRYPERFRRGKAAYQRAAVARSARSARRIIAVSRHTREDLIEIFGAPADRVSVVYSGVDPAFRPLPGAVASEFRNRVMQRRPYILHVGTLEPRKNVDVLLRAFALARERADLPHVLALVGARGWMYDSVIQLAEDLRLGDRVRFVDYVPPAELPLWYNGADLFAYPSAYEGFGLPVLEAMACGLPTITSASSALTELANGACVTVEPGSAEDLQMAITRVLEDSALRHHLRQAGLRRASQFSWAETARATVRVYEQAMADARP